MPIIRLGVVQLSGPTHKRFRLKFSLKLISHQKTTSKFKRRVRQPWIVYSDPFLVESRLDSAEAKSHKQQRNRKRGAITKRHAQILESLREDKADASASTTASTSTTPHPDTDSSAALKKWVPDDAFRR